MNELKAKATLLGYIVISQISKRAMLVRNVNTQTFDVWFKGGMRLSEEMDNKDKLTKDEVHNIQMSILNFEE